MRRWLLLALVSAWLLAIWDSPVRADTLRPGYLELTQQDALHWRVIWKAPLLGGLASRARPVAPPFCRYAIASTRTDGTSLISAGVLTCDRPIAGATVGLAGMESGFSDALLRIAPLDGPIQVERLTPDRTTTVVATSPANWQVAGTYLALGVEHILTGYDHLLLVVSLVLLLMRFGLVVKAVTAFTVAHSITLAGASLGLFGLPQAPVEALIALSILFLAVEIVKQVPGEPRASERTSWIVALLFGLLHGFGFAGALREVGLPEADVSLALLTFNLGVELGQLAIVAAVLALIALVRHVRPGMLRPAVVASSYVIGTLSAFWFIERLIA